MLPPIQHGDRYFSRCKKKSKLLDSFENLLRLSEISELLTYITMTKKVVCTHVPLIHVGDLAARGYWYYFPHVFWTEYLIVYIIDIKIRQKITLFKYM